LRVYVAQIHADFFCLGFLSFCRNRTDDLGINSSVLWQLELVFHRLRCVYLHMNIYVYIDRETIYIYRCIFIHIYMYCFTISYTYILLYSAMYFHVSLISLWYKHVFYIYLYISLSSTIWIYIYMYVLF